LLLSLGIDKFPKFILLDIIYKIATNQILDSISNVYCFKTSLILHN
jgi:hypothetical protein